MAYNCRDEQNTKTIGPTVRICQINVEGLSKSKSDYLSRLMTEEKIDILVLQETHTSDDHQLRLRGTIQGFNLLSAVNHPVYGVATYARDGLSGTQVLDGGSQDGVFSITIKANDLTITNVYKPPQEFWPGIVLDNQSHPAIYLGDFNSHHTAWGYSETDVNGESLVTWAEANNVILKYDAKMPGTFHSARWRSDTTPDLCFVSIDTDGRPLPASRKVLPCFPKSQHRPVIVEVGVKVPLVSSVPKPRWNFQKADWQKYEKLVDDAIRFIPPYSENYQRFCKLIIESAKSSIPRGYRKEYIPCWNEDSDRLYAELQDTPNPETAKELLISLDEARKQKWISMVESMNMTHSSRKAWSTLRKLGGAELPIPAKPKVHPNNIARRIVQLSKASSDKEFTRSVNSHLKAKRRAMDPNNDYYTKNFTEAEISEALRATKNGKAAGFDKVYPELLTHTGPKARKWLTQFYSDILHTGKLPKAFKNTKIIAILKPGKPADLTDSYRPIALLSVSLKILERLILNRINPAIEENIPREQAGFRKGRNCTDQILSLTNYIEDGYQKGLKTAVAFVDLQAAYDTVWKKGLLSKLLSVIPCLKVCQLVSNMLSDRYFRVALNADLSSSMKLNNGLPQGSVLAPVLFNLYIHDLPITSSRKFIYADDMAFAYQSRKWEQLESVLSADLTVLNKYLQNWRLQPSVTKTEVSCFHLTNRDARRKLHISFGASELRHNFTPKYLGVTLDRSLTYKDHLMKVTAKVQTRNNLIQKLASTTWGASAQCLRTSAMALVYSAAEYGAPVWLNSCHTQKIDVQLNTTMRIISGTVKSTPVQWLPALCGIAPPDTRRKQALYRECNKILNNPQIPLYADLVSEHSTRLKSRRPTLTTGKRLCEEDFSVEDDWTDQWRAFNYRSPLFDFNLQADRTTEMNLPRKAWVNLNRLRTEHGRCAYMMHKWGLADSPACSCGNPKQTTEHIMMECPDLAFRGELQEIKNLTDSARQWLYSLEL